MTLESKVSTRTQKSTVNFATGIFSQLVILVLNFVIRYVFIKSIGYEYLGINSLFTNILTILSVADLGFGSALGIVLYSSLSRKDEKEIGSLMKFFKKTYFIIGVIVTVAGLAITPFVKFLVNTDSEIPNLYLYFLLFLLNTVSSYFISYRAILIRADQKNSVVNNVTTIVKIAKAVLEALVLIICPKLFGLTVTYVLYLVVMVLATYAIGLITSIYAKKHYPYAFIKNASDNLEKKSEIISTTKDLFVYRLCNAFSSPIDSVFISVFVGTVLLGIYSNYFLIFTTLMEFICLLSRNVISSVGNFVVEKPLKEQKKLYFEMQIIYFAIIIFSTINFVSLATPFISLVFGEENSLSMWTVFLLGATLICRCIGELAIIFRETTKIYKRTKYISLFYMGIHILLSLIFGIFMGLEGILLGNVIAYFATNFWFELYALFKWYFKESPLKVILQFIFVILVASGISVGGYFLCLKINQANTFMTFILCGIVSLSLSVISLSVLFPIQGFKSLINRVFNIIKIGYSYLKRLHNNKVLQISVIGIYIISVAVLVLLRDLRAVEINKFIFLGLLILSSVFLNKSNGLWLIIFTLPFCPTLSELYILIFALAYLVLVSLKQHNIKKWIAIATVPTIIFVLEIVLSAIYGNIQFQLALRILVLLSLLAVIFYDRKELTRRHLRAFVLGCLFLFTIMAIDWWVPAIYGLDHKVRGYEWYTISLTLKDCRFGFSVIEWMKTVCKIEYPHVSATLMNENPNNVGLLSIVCLASISVLYTTSKRDRKILYIPLALLFVTFGIWSQSRTYIIVFGLLFLTFIFVPVIVKRRQIIDSALYFFGFISIICLVIIIRRDLFETFLRRFSDTTTSSGGGRLTLISDYLKFIFSDWKYAVFGVSCANLQPVSHISIVPHTNFIQFVGAYGLISFIGFITFIVVSSKKTKQIKMLSWQIYLLVPVFFTIIFTFTLQLFLPSIILISFIPGVMCLSFLNKDIDQSKKLECLPNRPEKVSEGSPIKVAMCATSFGGGICSYVANTVSRLTDKNFNFSLIFNFDPTDREIDRYKDLSCSRYYQKITKKKFKLIHLFYKYKYYLNTFYEDQPNLIYINTSSYLRSWILYFAARRYKRAHIIIHCHNPVNKNTKLPLKEQAAKWFGYGDLFNRFACSEESGKVFYGKSFLGKKKTGDFVIHNFINVEDFAFNVVLRKKIRKELGIKDSEILLGNVGRFDPQKNHQFLINLIKVLPEQYKLILLGDGPLKSKVLESVNANNLKKRVIFTGNVTNANEYYNSFDYFVLPSLEEGLPFVSVEAQCAGLVNILNDELPHSTAITDRVVFLPLDLNTWKIFIEKLGSDGNKTRNEYVDVVKSAGYSEDIAPNEIVNILRGIVKNG